MNTTTESLNIQEIQTQLKNFTKLGSAQTPYKTFFRFYDQELFNVLMFIIALQEIAVAKFDWEITLLQESINKNIPEEILYRCYEVVLYAKSDYELKNIINSSTTPDLYGKYCRENIEQQNETPKVRRIDVNDGFKIKNALQSNIINAVVEEEEEELYYGVM